MKKQMIAFMLSLAMVVASIGGSSVLAAETNGETGIMGDSVAETADDGADDDGEVADDETAVVKPTDDDGEVADDETAVVEPADDEDSAILEGLEDTSEENRKAVADSTADENAVQAIWTEGNWTITFYYGPIVEEGDYFGEETVTNVWVGEDVVTSHAWLSDNNVKYSIFTAVFDTSFQAVSLTSMSGWFDECSDLHEVDLRGLNTSGVTDMSKMFHGCESLEELDLSSFDTSNVTDMSNMFSGSFNLTSLDLSNFDTSNVINMAAMFCTIGQASLDLSNFDTSNVTNMNNMFCGCRFQSNLDLSNFDTSNVTDMSSMFCFCSSLKSLDLSSFDTSNVTDMSSMFCCCNSLESLDLSNFDTSKVTAYKEMFCDCTNLRTIYCEDHKTNWSWDDSTEIFTNCLYLLSFKLFSTNNYTNFEFLA